MNDLTEFHKRAAVVALNKMLSGRYFSICDLDNIAKLLGLQHRMSGPDYDALHNLHCVNWGDMGPELARLAREKCIELLSLPAAEVSAEIAEPPAPERKNNLLRIIFGARK